MTWNELTVKQFQAVMKVINSDESEITKAVEVLAAVSDKNPNYYRNQLLSETMGEYNKVMAGLGDMPKGALVKKFKYNKAVLSCEVSLDKMTSGQFIDFSQLAKQCTKGKELDRAAVIENYHRFLAIWFNYEHDPQSYADGFNGRAMTIQHNMPMSIAYPVAEHFFELWIALLPVIQTYLKEEVGTATGSQTGGTGMQLLTGWQTSVLRLLIRLLRWGR